MRWVKRRMTRFILALPLIPFLMMHAATVHAQGIPKTPGSIQLQSCHKICFTEGEKCVGEKGSSEPVCNTLEIGCVVSCGACIGGFTACMKSDDMTPRFCQNSFDTCLEQKLTASRARARPQIAFKGGDGLSHETAVVIDGALGELEGLMAENLWAVRHHPQWRKRDQTLIASDGRHFDKINYDAPDGAHAVWYDVSGFFGK